MIEQMANILVYEWLGLSATNHWGAALHFFVYDVTKISLLLVAIISFMGVINSYFPVEKIRSFLSKRKLYGLENLLASLLGAITPFCSCSSIPLFVGFLKGGIPLGVTLSFLITSPLVNEVALAIFLGIFGLKVTIAYATAGILLGSILGFVLGKFKLERHLEDWVQGQVTKQMAPCCSKEKKTFKGRIPSIVNESKDIFKRIFPYVLLGIGIGALIHGFVPTGYFEQYMGKGNIFSVPIATLVAIPMYSSASAVIPVVTSLVAKGIPLGTAMAFMMAVIGLSLPEAMLLKRVMKIRLIGIYFATVGSSIVLIGYIFNSIF